MNENTFDAEAPTPDETFTSPASSFPWPPRAEEGALAALGRTWKESTFHPTDFFRALPAEPRMGPAILYYLIVGIAVAAATLFWSQVLPQPELDPEVLNSPFGAILGMAPVISFLMAPIYQIFALFVGAAVTHLMLLMLTTQRGPYSRTVETYGYAYSPMLFGIIPWIGSLVGFIWCIVVSTIGLREAHRTTTGRSAAAILLPLVLIVILGIVLAVMVVAGAVLMTQ